ncbi:MAG: hypothetical protein KC414_12230, partial [Romboutsia sp.]|nr:hypothetical protein [Romboutsia sp.]
YALNKLLRNSTEKIKQDLQSKKLPKLSIVKLNAYINLYCEILRKNSIYFTGEVVMHMFNLCLCSILGFMAMLIDVAGTMSCIYVAKHELLTLRNIFNCGSDEVNDYSQQLMQKIKYICDSSSLVRQHGLTFVVLIFLSLYVIQILYNIYRANLLFSNRDTDIDIDNSYYTDLLFDFLNIKQLPIDNFLLEAKNRCDSVIREVRQDIKHHQCTYVLYKKYTEINSDLISHDSLQNINSKFKNN